MSQPKKIAVLTSGGDASTMNKCLSTFVTLANQHNCVIYFVHHGYLGLYENLIYQADFQQTKRWWDLKGSRIYSARFPAIKEPAVLKQMVQNLQDHGIDALVVIGGDGSYKGAALLASVGIKVFCLPGTIDNDVGSCTYSIGFDTALNTIVNNIKQIKSCMDSHGTVAMVEIMGRHCIDLTVFAGIATEAQIIITPQSHFSPQQLLHAIQKCRKVHKDGLLILYVENYLGQNGIPNIKDYVNYIHTNSNERIKINVLGYLQRGGDPSAMDMLRATLMVQRVFELIDKNEYNRIIGNVDLQITDYDLTTGLAMQNQSRQKLIDTFFTLPD